MIINMTTVDIARIAIYANDFDTMLRRSNFVEVISQCRPEKSLPRHSHE